MHILTLLIPRILICIKIIFPEKLFEPLTNKCTLKTIFLEKLVELI
jgi:hypothetical protein